MTNKLIKLEDRILELINTDKIVSAKEISILLKVEENKILEILNNDEFYNKICANSLSKLRLAHHSIAIPKLIEYLHTEVKFFEAYDRLSKAIGAVKERDNESLKLSLEVLLKENKTEKKVGSIDIENKTNGNIFEVETSAKGETTSPHYDKVIGFEFEEE